MAESKKIVNDSYIYKKFEEIIQAYEALKNTDDVHDDVNDNVHDDIHDDVQDDIHDDIHDDVDDAVYDTDNFVQSIHNIDVNDVNDVNDTDNLVNIYVNENVHRFTPNYSSISPPIYINNDPFIYRRMRSSINYRMHPPVASTYRFTPYYETVVEELNYPLSYFDPDPLNLDRPNNDRNNYNIDNIEMDDYILPENDNINSRRSVTNSSDHRTLAIKEITNLKDKISNETYEKVIKMLKNRFEYLYSENSMKIIDDIFQLKEQLSDNTYLTIMDVLKNQYRSEQNNEPDEQEEEDGEGDDEEDLFGNPFREMAQIVYERPDTVHNSSVNFLNYFGNICNCDKYSFISNQHRHRLYEVIPFLENIENKTEVDLTFELKECNLQNVSVDDINSFMNKMLVTIGEDSWAIIYLSMLDFNIRNFMYNEEHRRYIQDLLTMSVHEELLIFEYCERTNIIYPLDIWRMMF
jgi:hypothetical protein